MDVSAVNKLPRWAIPASIGGAAGLYTLWRRQRNMPVAVAPVQSVAPALAPDTSGAGYNDVRGLLADQTGSIVTAIGNALSSQPDAAGAIGQLTAAQQSGFAAIAAAQQDAAQQNAATNAAALRAINDQIAAGQAGQATALAALNAAIQRLFSSPVTGPALPPPVHNPDAQTGPPDPNTDPAGYERWKLAQGGRATAPVTSPAPAPSPTSTGNYGAAFLRNQLPGWQWIGNSWQPKPGGARRGEWVADGVGMPVDYNPLGDTHRWEFLGVMAESSMRRAIRWAADMWESHPKYGGQQALNFSMANLSSDALRGGFGGQLGWNPAAFRYNQYGEAYNDNIDYANPTVRYGG